MLTQSGLVVVLAALLVVLIILLVSRIRTENRRMAAVKRMRLEDFSAMLQANANSGTIAEVAGKVSDLLKSSVDCEAILFVRKKRGVMGANYLFGIDPRLRWKLHFPYSRTLAVHLSQTYLPRPVKDISSLLPNPFSAHLAALGVNTYFPVFWRDNLYGVYFVKTRLAAQSHSFRLLVASLAQSLSAAYHIKWHESKLGDLRLAASARPSQPVIPKEEPLPNLSDFMRFRHTDLLVPKLVDSMQAMLGMERALCIMGGKEGLSQPRSFSFGVTDLPQAPQPDDLKIVLKRLPENGPLALAQLDFQVPSLDSWAEGLRRSGFQYMALFTLSDRRQGLVAFSGGDSDGIEARLGHFREQAASLVQNAETYEELEELSYTDNLTGLANRRYLLKRLNEEIARASRHKRQLALVLFDLDELKATNDTYGHQAGDAVLRQLGTLLHDSIRTIDIVARLGGDEFCVIMPEASESTCRRFMQRLQDDIRQSAVMVEGVDRPIFCTISLGAALCPEHGAQPEELIHAADLALLKAKGEGRNRAVLYSAPEHLTS